MTTATNDPREHDDRSARPARMRRGYAAVMAMLFLVLGTSLAAGLYALVQSSTAITSNEQDAAGALGAAETGVQVYQYQICQASKQATLSSASSAAWIESLVNRYNGLSTVGVRLDPNDPANMTVISDTTTFGSGAKFSLNIVPTNDLTGLVLTVTGTKGTLTRKLSFTLKRVGGGAPWSDFAVVSEGDINLGGSAKSGATQWTIVNNAASADPDYLSQNSDTLSVILVLPDGTQVPGKAQPIYNKTNPANDPIYQKYKDYINDHTKTLTVQFPDIDPSFLAPLAVQANMTQFNQFPAVPTSKGRFITTTPVLIDGGGGTKTNFSLPYSPSFTGGYQLKNVTINGVLYVEYPASLTIMEGVTINGSIVFEPPPTGVTPSAQNLNVLISKQASQGVQQSHDNSLANAAYDNLGISQDNKNLLNMWGVVAPNAAMDFGKHNTESWFDGLVYLKSYTTGSGGGGGKNGFQVKNGNLVTTGGVGNGNGNRELLINQPASSQDTSTTGSLGSAYLQADATTYQELK